jgi:L-asparaginase
LTIRIFTTGGTFDKVYFDALSEFRFGEPIVAELLAEANVGFEYEIESLMRKDSLDINDADRETIYTAVSGSECDRVLIVHGTDGMIASGLRLLEVPDKTIVLFGAMQPARMRYSDAMFNLGFACAAVQLLPAGVHLAMNGSIFDPRKVAKNRAQGRFESRGE